MRLLGAQAPETPVFDQPLAAQRMFVGRDRTKSALMALSDPQGKVRLRLAVDSLGAARIEFLDAAGKVTRSLP